MRKSVRQVLPVYLLTAAVPLIPVLAFLAVPRPPASGCAPADCRAFAVSANSFRTPAPGPVLRTEFTPRGTASLTRPVTGGAAAPAARTSRPAVPSDAMTREGTR